MNLPLVASIIITILVFSGFFAANFDFAQGKAKADHWDFKPPYSFVPGEFVSYANAFFFVFIFSLLFFGFSAPIAMAIEGAKYASLAMNGLHIFDYVFIIPEFFAAYSAVLLGRGVMDDFEGKTIFDNWSRALKFFAIGLVTLVVLFFIRFFVVLPK